MRFHACDGCCFKEKVEFALGEKCCKSRLISTSETYFCKTSFKGICEISVLMDKTMYFFLYSQAFLMEVTVSNLADYGIEASLRLLIKRNLSCNKMLVCGIPT